MRDELDMQQLTDALRAAGAPPEPPPGYEQIARDAALGPAAPAEVVRIDHHRLRRRLARPAIALVVLWPAALPLAWATLVPPAGVDDERRGFVIAVLVMVSIAVTLLVAIIRGLAACWLAFGLMATLLYLPHRGRR